VASVRNTRQDRITGVTAKTRSAIEGFTARLGQEVSSHQHLPPPASPVPETEEDLDRQLKECFDRLGYKQPRMQMAMPLPAKHIGDELRGRVTESIVERILADWATPHSHVSPTAELKRQVIERLCERVIEQLRRA